MQNVRKTPITTKPPSNVNIALLSETIILKKNSVNVLKDYSGMINSALNATTLDTSIFTIKNAKNVLKIKFTTWLKKNALIVP